MMDVLDKRVNRCVDGRRCPLLFFRREIRAARALMSATDAHTSAAIGPGITCLVSEIQQDLECSRRLRVYPSSSLCCHRDLVCCQRLRVLAARPSHIIRLLHNGKASISFFLLYHHVEHFYSNSRTRRSAFRHRSSVFCTLMPLA